MTRKFIPENYIFNTQRHRDTEILNSISEDGLKGQEAHSPGHRPENAMPPIGTRPEGAKALEPYICFCPFRTKTLSSIHPQGVALG